LADYYEAILTTGEDIHPKTAANWVTGELLSLMNNANLETDSIPIPADRMAGLIRSAGRGQINLNTAKSVLEDMFKSGKDADEIIREKGFSQIVDESFLQTLIDDTIRQNPNETASYLAGKETLSNWFFGQVMAKSKGQASPNLVREQLRKALDQLKFKSSD
jgi:aspartyl-tRNA(Asn)/glutamyl-tRNA(Gln) amidotransferase subunit B